jgi:hypothetical protein
LLVAAAVVAGAVAVAEQVVIELLVYLQLLLIQKLLSLLVEVAQAPPPGQTHLTQMERILYLVL